MNTTDLLTTDPWRLEIIVIRDGSHTSGERRSVQRDRERGLLTRLRKGAYVEATAFEGLGPEERHIVELRALTATSDRPVVFSHWSAAVVHGLPVLRSRLERLHVTVETAAGLNARVAGHRLGLSDVETIRAHDLVLTDVPRTVVDIAGAAPMEEGVMTADGALRMGVPRALLELAVDLAGPRQSCSRIADVVAFAHPGAETAIESRGRVTMLRLGVEVPELQKEFVLPSGARVYSDFYFPRARAAAEADGDVKYLDPVMAPAGAGRAVIAEKRREDELRSLLNGLARFGWEQSGSTSLLRPVLARAGVLPSRPRADLTDYCAAASEARTRFVPRRPHR